MHKQLWRAWIPLTGRASTNESAVSETVSGIIVSHLSETLQPLWVGKQGEAGMSLSSQPGSTNIALVLAFYSQDCSHGAETLLAVHRHHSFGFTICPRFTHDCTESDSSSINWDVKLNLAVPARWATPQMLTDRTLNLYPFALWKSRLHPTMSLILTNYLHDRQSEVYVACLCWIHSDMRL